MTFFKVTGCYILLQHGLLCKTSSQSLNTSNVMCFIHVLRSNLCSFIETINSLSYQLSCTYLHSSEPHPKTTYYTHSYHHHQAKFITTALTKSQSLIAIAGMTACHKHIITRHSTIPKTMFSGPLNYQLTIISAIL